MPNTFKDLLQEVTFKDVQLALVDAYEEEEESIDEYKKVFFKLLQMTPKENEKKWKIVVEKFHHEWADPDDGEVFSDDGYEVHGRKPNDKNRYAIEFTAWNKWLSMNIDPKTLKTFTKAEIIAHCLYEMTFMSFDEADIQEAMESLKETVEEIKESLAKKEVEKEQKGEQDKSTIVTWEELKKRMEKWKEEE